MRRGISPIVATVLLVIIAVAAGVLIWAWMAGYAQRNPTEQPALQERIKIESVKADDSADVDGDGKNEVAITVFVKNIGNVKVRIGAVYVYDVYGNLVCKATDLTDSSANRYTELDIGETSKSLSDGYGQSNNYKWVGIIYNDPDTTTASPSYGYDSACSLTSGKPYIVKVVTTRGTEATYQFIAP